LLQREVYAKPALVPAARWLDALPPAQPRFQAVSSREGTRLSWQGVGEEKIWLWVLQFKAGKDWSLEILPGARTNFALNSSPDACSLLAVDRCGNASTPVVLERANLISAQPGTLRVPGLK
jgi:hypothetical protein